MKNAKLCTRHHLSIESAYREVLYSLKESKKGNSQGTDPTNLSGIS